MGAASSQIERLFSERSDSFLNSFEAEIKAIKAIKAINHIYIMDLHVEAILASIMPPNILVFEATDNAREKLARHCHITDGRFIVHIPRGRAADFDHLINTKCDLHLHVQHYTFISTRESTRGQKISGTKIILVDITSN